MIKDHCTSNNAFQYASELPISKHLFVNCLSLLPKGSEFLLCHWSNNIFAPIFLQRIIQLEEDFAQGKYASDNLNCSVLLAIQEKKLLIKELIK